MNKHRQILIVFSIVFYIVTFFIIAKMLQDQSASLGFVLIVFPAFWIIAIILLVALLIVYRKTKKTILDWVLILLCTPIPTILISFILSVNPFKEKVASTYEFNRNFHRHREVRINNQQGIKRIEYYVSQDSVNDSIHFPKTDKWLKDSIWIYIDSKGDTFKKVTYKNDILLK